MKPTIIGIDCGLFRELDGSLNQLSIKRKMVRKRKKKSLRRKRIRFLQLNPISPALAMKSERLSCFVWYFTRCARFLLMLDEINQEQNFKQLSDEFQVARLQRWSFKFEKSKKSFRAINGEESLCGSPKLESLTHKSKEDLHKSILLVRKRFLCWERLGMVDESRNKFSVLSWGYCVVKEVWTFNLEALSPKIFRSAWLCHYLQSKLIDQSRQKPPTRVIETWLSKPTSFSNSTAHFLHRASIFFHPQRIPFSNFEWTIFSLERNLIRRRKSLSLRVSASPSRFLMTRRDFQKQPSADRIREKSIRGNLLTQSWIIWAIKRLDV